MSYGLRPLGITVLLSVCLCPATPGQIKAKAEKGEAIKSGDVVVLELDEKVGTDVQIDWQIESGKGRWNGRHDLTTVRLIPEAPGQIVVVCKMIRPDAPPRELRTNISVVDSGAPQTIEPRSAVPQTSQPAAAARPAAAQAPVATRQQSTATLNGDIENDNFVPSGYQGDAVQKENEAAADPPILEVETGNDDQPHSPPACTKITYTPRKPGWVGLSYLPADADPTKVWGETAGQDYSNSHYQSLRVWARGAMRDQNYPRVQFISGGNTAPKAPHPSSYQLTGPTYRLTGSWKEYCLDLRSKNLSNVFSPLTVTVTKANNPKGAVFYIDTMHFSTAPCQ